jgi:hypothetical protein
VFATSEGLIVLFYEWRRQVFAFQGKGLIIRSRRSERNWGVGPGPLCFVLCAW